MAYDRRRFALITWCGLPWGPPPPLGTRRGLRRRRRRRHRARRPWSPASGPSRRAMVPTSPCAICRVDATDGCVRCGDVLCHEHAPPRGDQRCERCERAYRARVTSLRVATAIPVGVLALGLSGFAAMMAALFLSLPPEITIFLVLLGELAGGAFLTRQVDRLVSRTMRRRFLDGTDVAIPEARLLRGGGA